MRFFSRTPFYFLFLPFTLLSVALEDDSLISKMKLDLQKSNNVTESNQDEPAWTKETQCDLDSHSMQIGVRHSQGEGIGYHHGYTTIESFLSPRHCVGSLSPFLDLRGHVFNNGKFAANAGVGLRYLTRSIAWGINSYYDYRNTHEFHYNQCGAGLEAIGSFWSINVNGYLPVGKKKSAFYDPSIIGIPTIPSFAFFEGNQMFITLSGSQGFAAKREFAFKGLDTKFTVRAIQKKTIALDMGIGPYYFQGYYKKYAVGGEANITLRFSDYVTLSGTGSYDNLFHLRGQGSIGVSIPFGPKNFDRSCKQEQPCNNSKFVNSRLTRGSNRSEIIVLDHHEKILASVANGTTEVAVNPATGQPYIFWFVNNLSNSDGTYESPFPTIQEAVAAAQANDAIYVYPGDNSSYDVDNVTLLEGQYFLGSGFDQKVLTTVGTITIPAQTSTTPNLENTMGSTMITAADQSVVSGFNLLVLSAGNTVVANSINSFSFLNNTFSTSVTTGMNNLAFTDCYGTLLIQNNQFNMDPADTGSNGLNLLDTGSNVSTLSLLNNTFSNHASRAVTLNYSGSSTVTLLFENNSFTPPLGVAGTNGIDIVTSNAVVLANSILVQNTLSGYTSNGIYCNWSGTGGHNLTLSNNSVSTDSTVIGTNGYYLTTSASGASYLTVSDNQFLNQTSNNLQCNTSSNAFLQVTISGNTLSGPTVTPGGSFPNGIQVGTTNSSQVTVTINNQNILTNHTGKGINLFASDTSSISAIIDGNTISAPVTTASTTAINVGGNNSSALPASSFTITNNTCTGHTNGSIQCFPSQSHHCDLVITGNMITSAAAGVSGSNPIGIQVGASNSSSITNPTITNNTWTSSNTYDASGVPQGLSFGVSNSATFTNAVIDNNTFNIAVTAYQEATGPSGIQTYSNDSSTTDGLSITNNRVTFISSNYANNTGPSGISANAAGTSFLTDLSISNNTIAFAPQLVPFAAFQENGISVSGSDTATVGTSTVPAMIEQNTITQIEGNGITLLGVSNSDLYMTAANNSISLGSVQQNEIGIVTVPFGNGKLVAVIDGNTIEGNHGGFAGVVATNQSAACQSATIRNNTVTNVLGVNPSIPIPGVGGGLGAVILSSGNLNVVFDNNNLSGNTPQGIFGLDSAAFGGSGTICVQLQNNKGAGALPPDNYVLYNPTMASPTTFYYYNAGGNLGTLMFDPSPADFTDNGGPCPTCP